MSSNIYEDPNLTMNVKYCKGAAEHGDQRVERLVDIYDSVDAFTDRCVLKLEGGAATPKHPPDVQRSRWRAASLVLGSLCLLLGVTVIILYLRLIFNQPSVSDEELQNEDNILSRGYCQLRETENKTQGNITEWKLFKCSCYYKSTEMKNWTESRKDCQNRGADLVSINNKAEHDFLRKLNKADSFWVGLQPVSKPVQEWEWVDGSGSPYRPWQTGVIIQREDKERSRAFINPQGNLNQTNTGSKRWICEKQIDWE